MLDDIIDDLYELELNNQHFVCTIEEFKKKNHDVFYDQPTCLEDVIRGIFKSLEHLTSLKLGIFFKSKVSKSQSPMLCT
jgi:hypothetical protein